MHPTFFAVKRVHLTTLAVTRPMVAPYKLTPARFDMLRVVILYDEGIQQGTLRWLLGVSGAVVSRMLASLEALGFVMRYRGVDKRCLFVELTEDGREAVRMALAATVASQEADRTAARAVLGDRRQELISPEQTERTIGKASPVLAALDAVLAKMRAAFDDPAPFPHPWRRGDFVPLVPSPLFVGRACDDSGESDPAWLS